MKIKIKNLLTATIFFAFGLVAGAQSHTHTYSSQWSSDQNFHWHAASCGHSEYCSDKTDHVIDQGVITKSPTATAEGIKEYKCTVCGAVIKQTLPKIYAFHDSVQKVDTVTINGVSYDIVTFGDWPGSKKNDSVTIDENAKLTMGAYTYYLGSDSRYYAKIKESYYRVDPIRWRVLTDNYNGTKKSLLLAEHVLLDSYVTYYVSSSERNIGGKTVYANNYRYSTVRAWLNGKYESGDTQAKTYAGKGFLQTAFTAQAQSKIATTTVDNSVSSTGYSSKSYTCENTSDKIFLLSKKEVTNSAYGFESDNSNDNSGKKGYQWLRSPDDYYSYCARGVYYVGDTGSYYNVCSTNIGVVPALSISF